MKTENISLTANRFTDTREVTMSLVNSLEKEDFIIQSHPDVSPPKWHLAHGWNRVKKNNWQAPLLAER